MSVATDTELTTATPAAALQLDAVIMGAGVAGLYQLYQLREQGLRVRVYEMGSDVGGTWYWNRYPGAKFDSEAYIYQYLFDEALYKDWSWSARFPERPEVEQWFHYITDRLDLRPDIQFNTRVTAAHYDDERGRWTIRTDHGDVIDSQFFIGCGGMLSAPHQNVFEGQETFQGRIFHTSRWPKEKIDFEGKRVGVVGIGATGIQVIQTIAAQVEHLTVFARTPQYVIPMKNPAYGEADQVWYKHRFDELRQNLPRTFSGFEYDFDVAWEDSTPEERHERIESCYEDGSLKLWLASFAEMFFDEQVSEEVSEFVRQKMRERLNDYRLIDILVPTDYGFGTHRVPLEHNYLEVYHRNNIDLVGVRDNPIARITSDGVELSDGSSHTLDIIILATGFDAGTGALTRVDIRGRGGRQLAEDWGRDIHTTYGMMVHGYPNMLVTGAPFAPSAALCNMTTCLQQQTEWITQAVETVRDRGKSVIEPTAEGEQAWVDHHDETANATLVTKTDSWYMGSNIEGKQKRLLSYIGGVGLYRQKCDEETEAGYPSFEIV